MKPKLVKSGKYKGLSIQEKNRLIGSLGGLARAKNVPELVRLRDSIKGGVVYYLKYGPDKLTEAVKKSWAQASDKERKARVAGMHEATGKHKGAKLNGQPRKDVEEQGRLVREKSRRADKKGRQPTTKRPV